MAFVTGDRVKETSTTTGTGNLTLAGAVSGFQAFSIFANNDTFFYAVVHQTAAEWEVGIGTYVSATPALARTTVLESSNADALVSFSAGTKDIFVTHPSAMALQMEEMAAPGPAAANWITQYAFDNGVGAQVRTKDEYGLIDILSGRDAHRARKLFFMGMGTDIAASADFLQWGILSNSLEGTVGQVAGDADGQRKSLVTAASIDADAGIQGIFTQTRRDLNPDVTIKFKVTTTVTRRVWIGWVESDHMAQDTSAAIHKFALRLSTTAANVNFCIVNSDGTTETITQIATADAGVHTIRLVADEVNARWGYSFDGAAVTWVTANVPTAAQLMGLQVQIRTTVASAATLEQWFIEGSMDK